MRLGLRLSRYGIGIKASSHFSVFKRSLMTGRAEGNCAAQSKGASIPTRQLWIPKEIGPSWRLFKSSRLWFSTGKWPSKNPRLQSRSLFFPFKAPVSGLLFDTTLNNPRGLPRVTRLRCKPLARQDNLFGLWASGSLAYKYLFQKFLVRQHVTVQNWSISLQFSPQFWHYFRWLFILLQQICETGRANKTPLERGGLGHQTVRKFQIQTLK